MTRACKRKVLCVDCDDDACFLQGHLRSDCPKFICDRKFAEYEDCESCEFLKEYQRIARELYGKDLQDHVNRRADKSNDIRT